MAILAFITRSPPQPTNADVPIAATFAGRTTLLTYVQPLNAFLPIVVNCEASPKSTSPRFAQPLKALSSIATILAGKSIRASASQPLNAFWSIVINCESADRTTACSASHSSNADLPIAPTPTGTKTLSRAEQPANTRSSIEVRDSEIVRSASDTQDSKALLPTATTLDGIATSLIALQP